MTQCAMAIKFDSNIESNLLYEILTSNDFKNKVLKSCSWSSFRIEWNMFSYFKKDFYKEFIKIEEKPIVKKIKIKKI